MIPDSFLMGPLLFFRSIRILIEGETLLLRLKITWSFDGQKWMNPQFWATENYWIPPIPGLGRLSVHFCNTFATEETCYEIVQFPCPDWI